jgi:hypothetical protein
MVVLLTMITYHTLKNCCACARANLAIVSKTRANNGIRGQMLIHGYLSYLANDAV